MLRYALAFCAALLAGNVQAADLPYRGSGPAATDLISLGESVGRTDPNVEDFLRGILSLSLVGRGVANDRALCIEGEMVSRQRNGTSFFDGGGNPVRARAIRESTVAVDLCTAQMLRGADISANSQRYSVNSQADSDILAPWRRLAARLGADPYDNLGAMELLAAIHTRARGNRDAGPLTVTSQTNGRTITITNAGVVDAFYTLSRISDPDFVARVQTSARSPDSLVSKPAQRTLDAIQRPEFSQMLASVREDMARERSVDEPRLRRALASCIYGGDAQTTTPPTVGGCARAGLITRASEITGRLGGLLR